MQVNPYIKLNGECESAFTFSERCLGGELAGCVHYSGSPMAAEVPGNWSEKIMHASLTVGNQVLMGGDVAPDCYEAPKGFSLSIHVTSTADAERIFHDLAEGGKVGHAARQDLLGRGFAMLDRFGIPWLIDCEGSV